MPLNKTALATAMKSAMDSLADADKADRHKTYEALAGAIIDHIKANALVSVPATGLLAPGGGGPVTGAAVGTIS